MRRPANRRFASGAGLFGCRFGAPAAAADLGTSRFLGGTRHDWISDVAVDPAGSV